ncbi:MAG TPA: HIT family protein [Candidatus Micrarchaeota archaeon]|nr:HIT family protein [Candidatus Micrarchaeota archaeon]
MDTGCIFCKIVAGKMPSSKIYEDNHTVAVLDIFPACPGHTLVIPKDHHADFFDTPAATLAHVAHASKKVAHRLREALGVDSVNIINNSGANAGQVVFHLHFHVVPRSAGDGLDFKLNRAKADAKYLEEMSSRLKF